LQFLARRDLVAKQKAIGFCLDAARRNRYRIQLLIVVALLLVVAAAWKWGPLLDWLTLEQIAAWAAVVKDHPLSPVIVIGAYLAASLVLFPITLLIVATAMTFGPLVGFAYASAGYLLAAVMTYGIGYWMGHDFVARLSRLKVGRMRGRLARHGFLTMIVVHLVPVAPFTLVNMVAGAVHVQFRDFVLGTSIGMIPGIGAITIFEQQLELTWQDPRPENFMVLALLLIVVTLGVVLITAVLAPPSDDQ
jgi:phospholipase D1/2